jgi:hypothetical protein
MAPLNPVGVKISDKIEPIKRVAIASQTALFVPKPAAHARSFCRAVSLAF